jgi:ribosomal protein S18 acetylase RimI-like enzyme
VRRLHKSNELTRKPVFLNRGVYITNVAVDPKYRRQGIARAAMSFILQKCKGTARIDLESGSME